MSVILLDAAIGRVMDDGFFSMEDFRTITDRSVVGSRLDADELESLEDLLESFHSGNQRRDLSALSNLERYTQNNNVIFLRSEANLYKIMLGGMFVGMIAGGITGGITRHPVGILGGAMLGVLGGFTVTALATIVYKHFRAD